MTICLCGATGFYNRRELAQHIVDKHGANAPRALTLAQRIIDKLKLAPEEYAAFGIEPPSQAAAPSRAQRDQAEALPALPSPEAVRAAVEALHPSPSMPPAGAQVCSCCKERPARPGKKWCVECSEVARQRSSRPRGPRKPAVVESQPDPLDDVDAPEEPAPGEWGNGTREETPMAEQKKCAGCKKPFTPTDGRQSKCDDCAKCGGCKQLRSAGHKEWCPRAKKGDKKATGGGKKKAKARVAKRPTRETPRPVAETPVAAILDGNGTRKKAEALLVDLRDLRMKLDVKISHVEELVAIL